MRASRALVLITFFSLCMLVGAGQISIQQGNNLIEHANAVNQPSAPVPSSARGGGTKQANLSTSTHFEPLLLLLFGSILLSSGTAINLMLSRKLKRKSMEATTGRK